MHQATTGQGSQNSTNRRSNSSEVTVLSPGFTMLYPSITLPNLPFKTQLHKMLPEQSIQSDWKESAVVG